MDARLVRARAACSDGLVDEAIGLVARVVADSDDDADIVAAATLVPPPVDPLRRARLHLAVMEAHARVTDPQRRAQLDDRMRDTVDHFRPTGPLDAVTMAELARSGERAALLDAIAASAAGATTQAEQSRLHLLLASQALVDGRFGSAIGHVEVAGSLGGPGSDASYVDPLVRFDVARRTGVGLDGIVAEIRVLVEQLPFAARGWLALALTSLGLRAEASRLWAILSDHVDAVAVEAPEFLIATVGSAEVCAWLGDRPTAERLYERLLPHSGRHAIAFATTPYEGPVDLALGRLARVLGRTADAREHLRSSATACRQIHAPVHEAVSQLELARVEHPGTRARAEALARARDLATELGLAPLLAEIGELGAGSATGPFTPRESEIVEILSTGMTNAEIAERLFLSERTVENHVSRAMLKAGVSSRTALARWSSERAGTA